MGKAMDKANIPWTINAAYRDVFRQGITEGSKKATPTGSWHGGTVQFPTSPVEARPRYRTGRGMATFRVSKTVPRRAKFKGGDAYGLGRALDVTGIRGNQSQVWNWIDQNGAKFGIYRPMADDPPHIQPTGNFRELAAKIRAGFDPVTGKYQTDDGKPDPNFARKQEAQDRAQREAGQRSRCSAPAGRYPADCSPTARCSAPAGRYPAASAAAPPPEAPQETRPPADIPSLVPPRATGPNEFDIPVTAPRAGQLDPVMMARTIAAIQKEALRGINPNTTKEQAMAQGAKGRAALIAAGVPPAMAKAAMLDTGAKTAVLMGYGPGGKNATVMGFPIPQSMVQGKIAEGVGEAMQGYNPAAPGPVQGPPSPAQQRSEAPFGQWPGVTLAAGGRDVGAPPAVEPEQPGRAEWQQALLDFLQNFNPISTAEARGGRSQAGNLRAPQADPGTIQSRLSEATL